MAQRGDSGTRSLVPLGGAIALVLALGIALLLVRSARTPTNNAAPGQPSPSVGGTGTSTPGVPGPGVPGPGVPSAPGVRPGLPIQPTTVPTSPGASPGGAGTASPGTSPGTGGLPNTGGPFPWWLGLLPISLGLGLMRALHRRPAADGPGSVPAGSRVAQPGSDGARRSGAARHRQRPPSTPGSTRP